MNQKKPTGEEAALREAILKSAMLEALVSKEGALMLGPFRSIVFTQLTYSLFLRAIHEYAPHIIEYVLYDIGHQRGKEFVATVRQWSEDPAEQFRLFAEAVTEGGYGKFTLTNLDLSKPEATLHGENLFEVGLFKLADISRSPRTVCHWTRGLFAGFMSVLSGREVVCEEMACEFRGDEACEFVILPSEV